MEGDGGDLVDGAVGQLGVALQLVAMREAVEAELADVVLVGEVTGERIAPGVLGEGVVEGGVEGYDDRHFRRLLLDAVGNAERVGVVQGGEALPPFDLVPHLVVEVYGRGELVPAVDDADGDEFNFGRVGNGCVG